MFNKRVIEICQRMGAALIAALATGTICGILFRIIMRIIAIIFPVMSRGVTFKGSMSLLGTGIGYCLGISILFVLVESYLPKHWFKKGILFGIITLAIYGTPILHNPNSGLNGFQTMLTIILFSCVFLAGGLLMTNTVTWVRSRSQVKVLYFSFFVLIIPALFMLGQMTVGVVEEWFPTKYFG